MLRRKKKKEDEQKISNIVGDNEAPIIMNAKQEEKYSKEVFEHTFNPEEKIKEIDQGSYLVDYLEAKYPWIPQYYSKLKF